jgi:HK97 family phage major capsid protein
LFLRKADWNSNILIKTLKNRTMKKITGGALYRKIQMFKRFQGIATSILMIVGFLIVGSITGNIMHGVAAAALLPFTFDNPFTDSLKVPGLQLGKGKGDGDDTDAKEVGLLMKKLNETTEKHNTEIDELKALLKDKPDAADKIKALEDSISEKHKDMLKQMTDINQILLKQGTEISKLKDGSMGNVKPAATLEDAISNAVYAAKADIDKILLAKDKHDWLEIKAVVDMTTLNTIGAGSTQYTLTENTGKISIVRKRELRYMAAISVGTIGTGRALWVEETTEQGEPVFIAEGAGKTQLSVLYVEKTEAVKKIGVYGKVTTEMLADLPQLITYINNNLMRRLDIKVEDKLITALGTGEDPKGLLYYASAFAAPASLSGSNGVTAPNEIDVIEAISLQVRLAYGMPDTLFIHPGTMSKIKLIKDRNDRPVWKDYITIDGSLNISGMNIVETTAITEGYFAGGDTKVVNCLIREEASIQIGLDGNDFTNNKKTILVEKRLVQFVSANDTGVIVQGDFASAIAAITLV